MTLTDLIARVEAATAPDREVDVLIFRAIGAPVPIQFANKMIALTFDDVEQCYFAPMGDMRVRYTPPAYTASLDTALTLVPSGWGFAVGNGIPDEAAWAWCSEPGEVDVCHAATPALALCAAALKAREAAGGR